jgi:hypothetical protein
VDDRYSGRSSGGGALASQRLAELKLRMEANVSSGVGGVSGRAGGEVRGWVGLCFVDGLGVRVRFVSKSGWGWSRGAVIDVDIWGCGCE